MPKLTKIDITAVLIVVGALLLSMLFFHNYIVEPDGYQYLLGAKSFADTFSLSVEYGSGEYGSPLYLSRYGLALLLALLTKGELGLSLILIKILNVLAFSVTACLVWNLLTMYSSKTRIIVFSIIVFSSSSLFWISQLSTDILAQLAFTLTVWLVLKKQKSLFVLLSAVTVALLRLELLVPLLAFMLTTRKTKRSSLIAAFLLIVFSGLLFYSVDARDLVAMLSNMWFFITAETVLLVILGVWMYLQFRGTSVRGGVYVAMFVSAVLAYHFYFQHIVIFIPLLAVPLAEVVSKKEFDRLIVVIFPMLLFLLSAYTLNRVKIRDVDLYQKLGTDRSLQSRIELCLKSGNLAVPRQAGYLYHLYEYKDKIIDYNPDIEQQVLLDDASVRTRNISTPPGFIIFAWPDALHIHGGERFPARFYVNCQQN